MMKTRIKTIIWSFLTLIMVLFISMPVMAQYSGGTGEPNNPYQIAIPDDWVEIMNTSADWDKCFLMMSDIDVNGISLTPVGDVNNVFEGIFDGNDCTINNIDINMPGYDYVGLFGYIDKSGIIIDLTLDDVNITGYDYVGSLAGKNYKGSITNCSSNGIVSGIDNVGGLIGENYYSDLSNCYSSGKVSGQGSSIGGLVGYYFHGIMTDCYSSAIVSGVYNTGGLVGYNGYVDLNQCYSTGMVSGNNYIGGLVGWNVGSIVTNCSSDNDVNGLQVVGGLMGSNDGIVADCFSTSTVSGIWYVGGLLGDNGGFVASCYSKGIVSGDNYIGGLVGYNSYDGTVKNSYSTDIVSGYRYVGGLVGQNANGGTVAKCYSTGTVNGSWYVGGLVGRNTSNSTVTDCFWDVEDSNMLDGVGNMDPDPNSVAGKTTAEMQTQSTFTDAGWDFVGETVNGPNDVWWIIKGKDYPRLWWQLPVDDFNDCNAAPLWVAYEKTPELASLEETNGRLEVNAVGSKDYAEAFYVSDGWQIDANEPFAARVDFNFSKLGPGEGKVSLGLRPNYQDNNKQFALFEVGSNNDYSYYSYIATDGDWIDVEVWDRSVDDVNGVLYISYDPNSSELYFSNHGYWADNADQAVKNLSLYWWDFKSVYFTLGGGSQDMILTGNDAWLDNFAVDEGVIKQ